MTQRDRTQILDPAIGIHQRALGAASNRINRKVSTKSISHTGIIRTRIKRKTFITAYLFALSPDKCVFLLRDSMQKHRKIRTHRNKPTREHLLGGGADHHPVAIPRAYSQ